MCPELFHLDGLAVRAYPAAILAAEIVLFVLPMLIAHRRGLSRRAVLICSVLAAIAVPVGARLLFWATNLSLYRQEPTRLLSLGFGDFSLFGGLILAAAVVAATCRLAKWNAWAMADVLAPAVAIGLAVVRIGCFLRGCCFGIRTQVPWAVTYPSGSLPHLHQIAEDPAVLIHGPQPVHPTQLYELAAALIVAAVALGLMRRRAPAGVPFLAAALAYTAFRLPNEFLRAQSLTATAPAWFYPALYMLVIAVCVGALARVVGRARGA
jgi:phosphatidylglycerol:prolipoprotein diacylglycerol transferase